MIKALPNIISSFRIFGTVAMLFTSPLSFKFYIIYSLCGLSDILDGAIARATNSITELGSKLDSIADMLYYAVMLFKILPFLSDALPQWIWYFVAVVLSVRLTSYIVAALKYRKFASLHTYLNKFTGFLIFTVPYFFYGEAKFAFAISISVCVVAAVSSLEELIIHVKSNEYNPDCKQFKDVANKKQA